LNKRVLIVSPHFPPINAPDHQRIRMGLSYFEKFGWDVVVLTVDANEVEGIQDIVLTKTVPKDIPIIRTRTLPIKYTKHIGFRHLALRSLPYLLQEGHKILVQKKIDLVFFSTTMFLSMSLGRLWYDRFKIQYILDFQDPWLSDYYQTHNTIPPGGRFKYGFSQTLASIFERFTLKKASHIISVSQGYVDTLLKRYDWLKPEQFTVLPFGAPEKDFEVFPTLNIQQNIFDPNDGYKHWVYVGRGGNDMNYSLKSLFSAIQTHRKEFHKVWQKIKLHFVGTKYSIFDHSKEIEEIAKSYNLDDIVSEYPQRIPYFEALQCITDADALIVPGSDDPSYTASKIYPYILAKKPLLAIFNEQSSVVDILRSTQAGIVVTFRTGDTIETIATCITHQWLNQKDWTTPQTKWEAFFPYTAQEMTRRLCEVFDRSLELH